MPRCVPERRQAKVLGERFYTGGRPCRQGHTGPRYTDSGQCVECTNRLPKEKMDRVVDASKRWRHKQKLNDPRRAWSRTAKNGARSRARKAGVPYDLSTEYVLSITVDRCPVMGCELAYGNSGTVRWNSPNLDRIIPELGYVKGNVQVISHKANTIKSDATPEELMKVAQWAATLPRTQASPTRPEPLPR